MWCEVCIQIHFLAYEYPTVSATFFEKVILSPVHCFCSSVKISRLYMYRPISGFSILFGPSICLSLCQYHVVSITRAL